MLYLTPASGFVVKKYISDGHFGQIVSPKSGEKLVPGASWALDNGCFSDKWSESRWTKNIVRYSHEPNCLFAVVPDVVADAEATDKLWYEWSEFVQECGYKAAYVLQNGCTGIPENADAVFTGGDTAWKLGPEASHWVLEARQRGLWTHMGRVNSLKRLRYALSEGYDSADGTFITYGPDKNVVTMHRWVQKVHEEAGMSSHTGISGISA
jgi:hypothetical protein